MIISIWVAVWERKKNKVYDAKYDFHESSGQACYLTASALACMRDFNSGLGTRGYNTNVPGEKTDPFSHRARPPHPPALDFINNPAQAFDVEGYIEHRYWKKYSMDSVCDFVCGFHFCTKKVPQPLSKHQILVKLTMVSK